MTPSATGTLLSPRSWRRLAGEVAKIEVAVEQLTAAVQRHRMVSGEPARRLLEAERTSGILARGLDAYRDQLDGVARPARTLAAAHAGSNRPAPVAAYGPGTEADLGPSL